MVSYGAKYVNRESFDILVLRSIMSKQRVKAHVFAVPFNPYHCCLHAGVAAWERTLSTQPVGRDLVAQIGKMHARRGRLSYLRHEGCVEPSHNVLNLLRCNQDSFIAMYPSYPGDAVLVDRS